MDKLLDRLSACLNPEAARRVVDLTMDDETAARVAELAELANEGRVTAEELEEYKSDVEVSDLIAGLKLRAKRLPQAWNGL